MKDSKSDVLVLAFAGVVDKWLLVYRFHAETGWVYRVKDHHISSTGVPKTIQEWKEAEGF